jgi:hypothetical protein
MPILISSHPDPVLTPVIVELVPVLVVASPANQDASPEPVDALKMTWNSMRFHWFSVSAVSLFVPDDVSPGNFHCNNPPLFGAARLPCSTPPLKNAICVRPLEHRLIGESDTRGAEVSPAGVASAKLLEQHVTGRADRHFDALIGDRRERPVDDAHDERHAELQPAALEVHGRRHPYIPCFRRCCPSRHRSRKSWNMLKTSLVASSCK